MMKLRATRRFLNLLFLTFLVPTFLAAQNDLAVGVRVNIDTALISASRTFTVTVYNQGHTTVTGVHLSTVFTTGLGSITSSTATGSYAANDWNIGTISAATDSVMLTLTTTVTAEGVQTLTAQITAMVEADGDSSPNNNSLIEDDLTIGCLSVPIYYCDGATINLTATATAGMTYMWYKDGVLIANANQYSLSVNSQGNYTVLVTNSNNCSRTRTIVVTASDAAVITNVITTDLSDNNTILVTASGQGTYVYSIDGTTYQTSNNFTNVAAGIYTVYVKDLYGCGISTKEISVLGIPTFFTPNGDGFNDYWNVSGANERLNSTTKIQIFDRFGKLIKQINPTSQGWDGTFNQLALPSDDYWYSIQFENQKVVKGHFALKR